MSFACSNDFSFDIFATLASSCLRKSLIIWAKERHVSDVGLETHQVDPHLIVAQLVIVVEVDVDALALLAQRLLDESEVGHQDADEARLVAVAVDEDLQDVRTLSVDVLDLGGGNVLALGQLEDVLLAVDDLKRAVLIGEKSHRH